MTIEILCNGFKAGFRIKVQFRKWCLYNFMIHMEADYGSRNYEYRI